MKQLLLYLLTATRGGPMRQRIVKAIKAKPMNAHQLAQQLKVDYKTVQHHLNILVGNTVFSVVKKGYGAVYFLTPEAEHFLPELGIIWEKVLKQEGR